ncbi:type-1 restriction enzyme EcoKI specificity protein [Arenibacter sp. NBRC 103722]|uniref:restriction endonuclease subunit S n=1 Tax=Arenibacter sp. NBRC 103722 TaxID=1113929 RepID=UPI00085323FC|nr:restriction endonuclease subunit S [Arenibacter sp. NBRC 103722]GBF22430.1 type-1 restriction enzyme EcoKI specificity protein [Arenibacter sp. NBRC 103722]
MIRQFKIGDFLKRIKNQIDINDSVKYKRVTVSGNHNGVSLRDEVLGSAIGTKKQFTIKGGNFILSKIDARNGAFGIIPQELDNAIITGNFWTYSVDTKLIDIEWFFYFTHSYNFIQICIESSTGSTHRKYMDEKVFLNHKIVLPEIDEQKEMVKKYKTSSKISNNLTFEIQTQKQLLSQLKQSILQEAIQGKLTADWRAKRALSGAEVEPAGELLKRIKAEKDQLIKDKKFKKEKPLPPITAADIPFELPEGWVWCRIASLYESLQYGTSKKCSYDDSQNTVILRIPNVSSGNIVLSDLKYTNLTQSEKKQYNLKDNDLLIIRSNGSKEIVGKAIFVDKKCNDYGYAGYLIRLRFGSIINEVSRFLELTFSTYSVREQIEIPLRSTVGINNINSTEISNLVIPFPPLEEQKAIVKKVEGLMQKYQALEQEIKTSESHAQMLMQAVLKEAFEGKQEVVEV